MNLSWKDSVCQSSSTTTITNFSSYIGQITTVRSPIDHFYNETKEILRIATPTLISSNKTLGGLFLIGIVSSCENYFRDIISKIIRICPIAKKKAIEQPMVLGSALWHGSTNIERSALENISFSSKENIVKYLNKLIGIDILKTSSSGVLDEFEKICELRHVIVHSSSYLSGKNALKLDIAPNKKPLQLIINFNEFQESASVCTNLVTSVNRELFSVIGKRFAVDWRNLNNWQIQNKNKIFNEIWNLFLSKEDLNGHLINLQLSKNQCLKAIEREFRSN